MLHWIRPKNKKSLANSIAIAGAIFVFVLCFILYFVWFQGAISIIGIPLQMLLITVVLPVAMAGLIFRLARNLDWLENDE